jgi:hypothetical protein
MGKDLGASCVSPSPYPKQKPAGRPGRVFQDVFRVQLWKTQEQILQWEALQKAGISCTFDNRFLEKPPRVLMPDDCFDFAVGRKENGNAN